MNQPENPTANHQAQPGSLKPDYYVANVRTCQRVGIEQWQFFTDSRVLTGSETIAEVFAWAQTKQSGNPNVVLVKAT